MIDLNFFKTLYQNCESGNIELRNFNGKRQFTSLNYMEEIDRYCEANKESNLYFGVGLRNGKGGTKDHLTGIPSVWCDVDYKDTSRLHLIAKLDSFPHKPSIIVKSGGGVHFYWILKEPLTKEDIPKLEDMNKRIASILGGDPNSTDAARVLRIPGTVNHKYKDKPKCVVSQIINNFYVVDDFDVLPEIATNVQQDVTATSKSLFQKGNRDADLFYTASCLYDGKMNPSKIEQVLILLASKCSPPFPQKEALIKVKSVLDRASRKGSSVQQEVWHWIEQQDNYWNVSDCYHDLGFVTTSNKAAARVAIGRFKEKNLIVHHHSRAGCYRRLEVVTEPIDFLNVEDTTVDLKLPLNLRNHFIPMAKNIIQVSGTPDAGKSAFMFNVVEMNMLDFEIDYWSSEMGPPEMRSRLIKADRDINTWKFNPRERSSNFAEVINPNRITIIDYLEIHEEAFRIGRWIKDIFDKLDKGIAIIAIQRKPGQGINNMGVGGLGTLEKPRLVINMGPGTAKIIKCKNWATETNPNGLQTKFKLVQGIKFLPAESNALISYDKFIWEKEE